MAPRPDDLRMDFALLDRIARGDSSAVGELYDRQGRMLYGLILSLDRGRDSATLLMKVAPGTTYPAHHHKGPEECYVISGEVTIHGQVLKAGDFHHAEPGSDHEEMISIPGCEVLLVVTASDYLL